MAILIRDTFTDTDGVALQSHTPDQGGAWQKYPGYTDDAFISANRLGVESDVLGEYTNATTPPTANYRVSADVVVLTLEDLDNVGLMIRADHTVSAGNDTYYFSDLTYNSGTATLTLQEGVAGVFTELGSYTPTLVAGNTYAWDLDASGTTLRVLFEGVERINTTDSSISAAGRAGLYVDLETFADTTGMKLDNYLVTYTASLLWRPGPVPSLVAR